VERFVQGRATRDGAGVRLMRVLTPDLQRRLDPFLMLDAFGSDRPGDYIAGFPDHPHRGFETVTYMLEGRLRHRDSAGHEGLLTAGGVQWMTAGRGVIHSETPEQEDGRMEGFQLWLNLPARRKMVEPEYRDIRPDEIPEWRSATDAPGVTARVIAGRTQGVAGAIQREDTEPLCLDLHLDPQACFEQPLGAYLNAFVYVYRGGLFVDAGAADCMRAPGELRFPGGMDSAGGTCGAGGMGAPATTVVPAGRMVILENKAGSDGVRLVAGGEGARAILVAGRPLNEPIAQWGPFVMNTQAEIVQAVEDYRAGRLA
jgi:redox-sensitive bicupin YhaK (pirin superfamily)